jgi:hypothetical protein
MDLERLERRARQVVESDGLVRLLAGIWLVAHGLFNYDHRHVWAPILAIQVLLWSTESIRQRFTYPRIGYVRFRPSKTWIRVTAALVLIGAYAFAGVLDYSRFDWFAPAYLGVFLAIVVGIWAYRSGSWIDFVFAGLCLVSGLVGLRYTAQGADDGYVTAVQFWALGTLPIAVGLGQLLIFLRRYPEPTEGAANVNI